jgi:biopolymer transport protein ExbB
MANAKKENGTNGGGMMTGIIIASCILVGIIVWKFIMGAPGNFENEKAMIEAGAEAGNERESEV